MKTEDFLELLKNGTEEEKATFFVDYTKLAPIFMALCEWIIHIETRVEALEKLGEK